jgi:hypothetical protein
MEKNMPSPPPLLLTTDDRVARIESLLVALGTRVDRIERLASRIDVQTRKQDGKRRSEL